MELTISSAKQEIIYGLAGSVFIAFCSSITIPIQPIPFTLMTLALFIIALTQSPRAGFLAALFYLIEATVGLPVLGRVDPLWFMGKTAGYLVAFPIATYLMSYLASKNPSIIHQIFSLVAGQIVIYLLGFAWLSTFIGIKLAFIHGVAIFIPSAIFKIAFALGFSKFRNKL